MKEEACKRDNHHKKKPPKGSSGRDGEAQQWRMKEEKGPKNSGE